MEQSTPPSTPRRLSVTSPRHPESRLPSEGHPSTPLRQLTTAKRFTPLHQSPLETLSRSKNEPTSIHQGSVNKERNFGDPFPSISSRPPEYSRVNGDTPLRHVSTQSLLHSITVPKLAKHRHQGVAKETAGHFIGPITPQVFFENYLPISLEEHEAFGTKFSEEAKTPVNWETGASQEARLIDFVTPFLSNVVLGDTKNQPDPAANGNHPDVGAYPKNIAKEKAMKPTKTKAGDTVAKYRTDFSRMSCWIELKRKDEADAFEDPGTFSKNFMKKTARSSTNPAASSPIAPLSLPPNGTPVPHPTPVDFDSDTVAGREARGQMATYASASLGLGFRTHLFSVYIRGDNVRFLRWDRAGAIVTSAFDRRTPDGKKRLAEFFWRFDHVTSSAQGFDDTVRNASQPEINEAQHHFDDYYASRTNTTRHPRPHFYVLTVPNQDEPKRLGEYIIEQPEWTARSTFGRSTRGMIAYRRAKSGEIGNKGEPVKGHLVYLKDYWRAKAEGITKEADVYAHLHAHDVPHIAPLDRGGDIGDCSRFHETHTQRPKGSGSPTEGLGTPILETFVHYRLTLDIVAISLLEFVCSLDVLIAVCHAMRAHAAAWNCGVLHRDISAGNIMIVYEPGKPPRGILIDWDLCFDFHSRISAPQPPGPRRPRRTGTWLFMSSNLLQNPSATHEFVDDIESVYWLLTWIALLWMHNKLSPEARQKLLRPYDEIDSLGADEAPEGGSAKEHALTTSRKGAHLGNVEWQTGTHWNALFIDLRKYFAARYREEPEESDRRSYERVKALAQTDASFMDLVQDHRLYKEEQRVESMKKPGWLSNKLQEYIDKEGWPVENDGPRKQQLAGGNPATTESQTLGSKRNRDDGDQEDGTNKKAKSYKY